MLQSSLSYIIVRSFPECICLILASYMLLSINLKLDEIIKKSIVFVLIVLCIRSLPISFGIHTIMIMFVLGIILYKFKKQNIISTIMTIAKIFICLALSEAIYVAIATSVLNISDTILMSNNSIESALLSLPSLIIFIVLIIIVKFIEIKFKKRHK